MEDKKGIGNQKRKTKREEKTIVDKRRKRRQK